MYLDFSNLVFNIVHHIVELEIDVDLADPVVVVGKLPDLPVHVLDEACVGVEMHRLDVDVHVWILIESDENAVGRPNPMRP